MDTWQDGADFARPKWGIYRSLNKSHDLQDEAVLFANFSIEEIELSLSIEELVDKAENLSLIPNPITGSVVIKNLKIDPYDGIELYDHTGKQIPLKKRLMRKKLDFSGLQSGLYYLVFRKNLFVSKVLK